MEIRANYALIGAFTLLVLVGGLIFTMWLVDFDRAPTMEFDIYYEERVSGLAVNSDVLFNGIRVGSVTSLKLDPNNPSAVRARISIAADTPVREDSEATLENKGVTGLVVISIAGGTADSPLNIPKPGQVGTIRYRPSALAAVMNTVPATLESVNRLLVSINDMFSEQNKANLTAVMQGFGSVGAVLEKRASSLDATLGNLENITAELDSMVKSLNIVVHRDGGNAAQAVSDAAQQIEKTVKALDPALQRFSREGLLELRLFFSDARRLADVLARLGENLENDPRRFLFGEPVKEFKAP